MKTLRPLVIYALVAVWSVTIIELLDAAPVTRRGSDVLHLMAKNVISPTDLGPSTGGSFKMQYNEQGQSIKQTVDLIVTGLEPNATAGMTASVGEDTNVVTVHSFTTDAQGRVRASFVDRAPRPAKLGRNKQALPELMNPLSNVRALCVENAALQVVGFAWIADSPIYQYIVKRNLTQTDPEGTVAGSINLLANQRRAKLRLVAGGLTPGAEYSVVMDGAPVATVTANDAGRVTFNGWPAEGPEALLVRSLALTDSEGATLLSTSLPE